MHIGVNTQGFVVWGGGIGFIENLLFGLLAVPDKVTKITVFVPAPPGQLRRLSSRLMRATLQPSQAMRHLRGTSQDLTPGLTAPELFSKICSAVVSYDGTQTNLRSLCRKLHVDVLLPSMATLGKFGLPWAGYLFDCQHRYYPQFFQPWEITRRDRDFARMLRAANCVIVNAQAAVNDLNSFFPSKTATIFSLPFSPLMRSDSISAVVAQTALVKRRYATSDNYFIVSNQFWIHKDHGTAFKAFSLALEDAALRDYKLVCTGALEDYRFPGYFAELRALLVSLRIEDKVIFTGYIDKLDQLALLNGARLMLC